MTWGFGPWSSVCFRMALLVSLATITPGCEERREQDELPLVADAVARAGADAAPPRRSLVLRWPWLGRDSRADEVSRTSRRRRKRRSLDASLTVERRYPRSIQVVRRRPNLFACECFGRAIGDASREQEEAARVRRRHLRGGFDYRGVRHQDNEGEVEILC